jgi:hypothetical protein
MLGICLFFIGGLLLSIFGLKSKLKRPPCSLTRWLRSRRTSHAYGELEQLRQRKKELLLESDINRHRPGRSAQLQIKATEWRH